MLLILTGPSNVEEPEPIESEPLRENVVSLLAVTLCTESPVEVTVTVSAVAKLMLAESLDPGQHLHPVAANIPVAAVRCGRGIPGDRRQHGAVFEALKPGPRSRYRRLSENRRSRREPASIKPSRSVRIMGCYSGVSINANGTSGTAQANAHFAMSAGGRNQKPQVSRDCRVALPPLKPLFGGRSSNQDERTMVDLRVDQKKIKIRVHSRSVHAVFLSRRMLTVSTRHLESR